jgi:RNA polymerase sigma-70 factor (ECF subfamily)
MKAADRSRFEREAMPHMQAMYGVALKLTHGEDEAQELVQETMVKAYRCFDSYDAETNCRAWLMRILMNTFINEYRRHKRELSCLGIVTTEAMDYCETIQNTPEKELEKNESIQQKGFFYGASDELIRALNAISNEFKSIIVMADLLDFSYKEISDKLGIPIGTVMSRLSRARQILKKKLSGYAGELGYCVE